MAYAEIGAYCGNGKRDADASTLIDCVVASKDEPAMRSCWGRYLDKAFRFLGE